MVWPAPSCALVALAMLGSLPDRADLGRRGSRLWCCWPWAGPGASLPASARTRVASRRLSAERWRVGRRPGWRSKRVWAARRRRPGGHRAGPARHGSWGGLPGRPARAGHQGLARHLDAQAHHGRLGRHAGAGVAAGAGEPAAAGGQTPSMARLRAGSTQGREGEGGELGGHWPR